MFNYRQFREFVSGTLEEISGLFSLPAVNLLLGTCAQESLFGTFLHQIDGPGLGIYSMEPETEKDIWENYLAFRPNYRLAIIRATGITSPHNREALVWNLKYATLMARMQYRRDPLPLPPANDIRALGEYWDRVYNRNPNKGTVEEFIGNYMHYCRG